MGKGVAEYGKGSNYMKIVVLDGYTLNPGDLDWDGLKAIGPVTVYDRTGADEAVARIGDAEAVFTNKTLITQSVLDACPKVRFIGVLATGYNVVDTQAAKARSIPVCNVPTYGTAAVAQFVFALLLEICHHVADHDLAVKNGEWTNHKDFCFWKHPLIELAGKTLGLIGYGRIGKATAAIARAFGMQIAVYDDNANAPECMPLREMLAVSDVVSIHCPLMEETKGLINAETIRQMKDGAIIINTARGPIVNEADLAAALNGGKLYYAATDVVSTEPIQADNPLLTARHCIITPHIAWANRESRKRLMDIAVDNLRAFAQGAPKNVVNP